MKGMQREASLHQPRGSVGLSSMPGFLLVGGEQQDCRDVVFSQGMGSRGISRAAGTVSQGA